jgi:uncharacterized protein (TIGR02145 family)
MRAFIVFLILLACFSFLSAQNKAPEVTNVSFSQRGDGSHFVDVHYDLNDVDGDTMSVLMLVSNDAGATWNFRCDSISGHEGKDIISGTGKHIVWDFGGEHPQTFGEQFQIKIIADDSNFEKSTVTDFDGNIYITIKIGEQWWMAENLKVTHYRNGDAITNITVNSEWNRYSEAYCAYNNADSNMAVYGLLYNWYVVSDIRNMAPLGWHVPTYAEWRMLVNTIGDSSTAGSKMREIGNAHWLSPNTDATNSSGFSAIPGGYRQYSNGEFQWIGYDARFWSSTVRYSSSGTWCLTLNGGCSYIFYEILNYRTGHSVRCVRD